MAPVIATIGRVEFWCVTITSRVGRHLQRRGWLTRDAESSHLTLDREATALDSLLSHSITYRIALGSRAGQKAFTLRSLPATPLPQPSQPFLASADGCSLHAGDRRGPVVAHRSGSGALHPADALPGRHHPRGRRAAGRHGAPGGAGAEARAHLTRYHGVFAPPQPVAGGGDAGGAGEAQVAGPADPGAAAPGLAGAAGRVEAAGGSRLRR